jgi:hypothetical protein
MGPGELQPLERAFAFEADGRQESRRGFDAKRRIQQYASRTPMNLDRPIMPSEWCFVLA